MGSLRPCAVRRAGRCGLALSSHACRDRCGCHAVADIPATVAACHPAAAGSTLISRGWHRPRSSGG
eukprot:4818427-Pleurochrysis_carterae.AAC.1